MSAEEKEHTTEDFDKALTHEETKLSVEADTRLRNVKDEADAADTAKSNDDEKVNPDG